MRFSARGACVLIKVLPWAGRADMGRSLCRGMDVLDASSRWGRDACARNVSKGKEHVASDLRGTKIFAFVVERNCRLCDEVKLTMALADVGWTGTAVPICQQGARMISGGGVGDDRTHIAALFLSPRNRNVEL